MKTRKRRRSQKFREHLRALTLMDNNFMNAALSDNIPCVEEMLRVILGRNDLVVKSVETQKMLQGFERSVCLDVYAEDSNGIRYNIEIQNADDGADPKRARFHTGMIDVHSLEKGQDFSELPECYVIFITRNDVLGLGRAIYTIHKYIDDVIKPFHDGAHTIYINCSAENDGSEIWKLIHDLNCPNAEEMYFPMLAERVGFLKFTEEGESEPMDNYFEEWKNRAVKRAEKRAEKRGEQRARMEEKESLARNFLMMGKLTLEDIAKGTGLTLEAIQRLAETNS